MKLTVYVNNLTFESKTTSEISVENAKDNWFETINSLNKFEMETSDGNFIIFGEQAINNAIFVFSED